jgi:2-haloacid dehalogenase
MNALLDRRNFIRLGTGAAAGAMLGSASFATVPANTETRAIVFDAFVLFDPRPLVALAEELFPGRGSELSNLWRTRQFEYTWLRTVAGQYADFREISGDALSFAATALGLTLDPHRRARLLDAYLQLKTWPDVPRALASLQRERIRLAILSNFTQQMLDANLKNSGLGGVFEHILSTDRVRHFKPSPHAYRMAEQGFGLARDRILFAAFAGWDAVGAKWFGFPTVWVNRLNSPAEELSIKPDVVCTDLSGVLETAIPQPPPDRNK